MDEFPRPDPELSINCYYADPDFHLPIGELITDIFGIWK